MKVVCIIQARLGSHRFPAKVLANLCGKPMLAHVLARAAQIQGVAQVVLAVPESDLPYLKHLWPDCVGGPAHDVLARYAEVARLYRADVIVRITGDCPLLAPDLSSRAVAAYAACQQNGQYVAMCQPYTPVADGWDTEVFSAALLNEAHAKARKGECEHVVTWMRRHGVVSTLPSACDWTALKCSVDTVEDLARVRLIMEFLHDPTHYDHAATWEAWLRAGRP